MKSSYFRSFIGFVFVISALFLLGVTQSWWNVSCEFDGAIGLLFSVPAVIWIFFFGINIINSALFNFGIGFILYQKEFINNDNLIEYIIVFALLSIGLTIIGSLGICPEDINVLLKKPKPINRKEFTFKTSFLKKHISCNFDGLKKCEVSNKFTKFGLNLSEAKFDKTSIIIAKCYFGQMKILVPFNTLVTINSNNSFGKVDNKLGKINNNLPIMKVTLDSKVRFGKIVLLSSDQKTQQKTEE